MISNQSNAFDGMELGATVSPLSSVTRDGGTSVSFFGPHTHAPVSDYHFSQRLKGAYGVDDAGAATRNALIFAAVALCITVSGATSVRFAPIANQAVTVANTDPSAERTARSFISQATAPAPGKQ